MFDMGSQKSLPFFVVDAFTKKAFSGNPAAVCVLPSPNHLDDEAMLAIAGEMNLPETAFVSPVVPDSLAEGEHLTEQRRFVLRWFTPITEVSLCGHATLATAFVLFEHFKLASDDVVFETLSGDLGVKRDVAQGTLQLNFPSGSFRPIEIDGKVPELLGIEPSSAESHLAKDFILIRVPDSFDLKGLKPDFDQLLKIKLPGAAHGVIVTRRGPLPYDFTSRVFSPWIGIREDPVTGAAHAILGPYWAGHLKKSRFIAYQDSPRGGGLGVEMTDDCRVILTGTAVLMLKGALQLP